MITPVDSLIKLRVPAVLMLMDPFVPAIVPKLLMVPLVLLITNAVTAPITVG